MAGQTQIGKLAVLLTADSSQMDRTFDRVQARVKQFGKDTGGGGLLGSLMGGMSVGSGGINFGAMMNLGDIATKIHPLAAALIAAGAAAKLLFSELVAIANKADDLRDMAAMLGGTAEGLAGLKQIAGKEGGDEGAFDKGMMKLSREIGAAVEGSQEAEDAFKKLGVSGTQLAAMPLEEAFSKVAEQINKLPTQAQKTRAEFEIFGKTGMKLDEMIKKAGLFDEAIKKAHQRGAVGSEKLGQAGEDWERTKAEFSMVWEGVKNRMAEFFLPLLDLAIHWTKDLIRVFDAIMGNQKSEKEIEAIQMRERMIKMEEVAQKKKEDSLKEEAKMRKDAAKAADDAQKALKQQAQDLDKATMSPLENFQEQMRMLDDLRFRGILGEDLQNRGILQQIEKLEAAVGQSAITPLPLLARGSQADRSFGLQMDRERQGEKPINQRIAEALGRAEQKDAQRNILLQQIRDGVKNQPELGFAPL